jgi:hypothetical protein
MKRRHFLRTISAAAAGTVAGSSILPAHDFSAQDSQANAALIIQEPFDGAILHERHGNPVLGVVETGGKKGLRVLVEGQIAAASSDENAIVKVNGTPVAVKERQFHSEVVLRQQNNVIKISLKAGSVTAEKAVRVSWQLPEEVCEYLSRHDGWMEYKTGLIFSRIEMVVNNTPLDKVIPILRESLANPNMAEVIDLLTHEQYFWPFYKRYLPDHRDRLDAALAFLTEHGYKPVFLDDGFYGA